MTVSGGLFLMEVRNMLVAKVAPTITGRIKNGSGEVKLGNHRAPKIVTYNLCL
jgi:hypothetical protein